MYKPGFFTISEAQGSDESLPFCTQAYMLNMRVLTVRIAPGLNYKEENPCVISAVLYSLSKYLQQVQVKPNTTCTSWYGMQWVRASLPEVSTCRGCFAGKQEPIIYGVINTPKCHLRQSLDQNRALPVTGAHAVLPPPLNWLLNEQNQFDLTHPTSISKKAQEQLLPTYNSLIPAQTICFPVVGEQSTKGPDNQTESAETWRCASSTGARLIMKDNYYN